MTRWRRNPHWLAVSIVLISTVASAFLSACSQSAATPENVTLTFSTWQGGAAGDSFQAVIKSYQKLHPNVTIQYRVNAASEYTTILNTHFAAGDADDIVAFSPTSFSKTPYVKAGRLLDLSDQPWVGHMLSSVKITAVADDAPTKTYAMPVVQDMGGVIYNRDIFSKLNLQIPTTWPEFLKACAAIKASGVAPIAVGAKDGWPLEQFLYNMLVNTVYRDDPNFSAKQVAGSATYAGSQGWKQALTDMAALAPYFNTGSSSTDFAGTANLLATGKAAMTVNGDFTLGPAETANPNIKLGIFPLPYVQDSTKKPNLTTFVDVTLGISAKSKHADAAKQFLQYFAQPDVMASFLTQRQGLATFDNVSQYKVDTALTDALPLMKNQASNEAVFGTTSNVGQTMWKDAQAVLTGSMTPTQMLQDMDKAFKS
jgi:raffinose/stachyose/melibiose transport system substrate-binding protein